MKQRWVLTHVILTVCIALAGCRGQPPSSSVGATAGNGVLPAAKEIEPVPAGKIVFVSTRDGNPEIYLMNPDGSAQTRLTNNDREDMRPVWSPDGRTIAFTQTMIFFEATPSEVWVMSADGSGQTKLPLEAGIGMHACWSPDGGKFAYARSADAQGSSRRRGIFVSGAAGTGEAQLTNGPDRRPVWSPDGSRIGFIRALTDECAVFVVRATGGRAQRLIGREFYATELAWSPDARRIAFVNHGDQSAIYVMNADGSDVTKLSDRSNVNTYPTWSRDGKKIAFLSDDRLWLINADGTRETKLSDQPVSQYDCVLQWSPDGTRLLFVSGERGDPDDPAEIYVINADGTGLTNLTNNPADDYDPNWRRAPE